MGFPDALAILVGFSLLFLLVGTALVHKLLQNLPFAKIYFKLRAHYDEHCPIFTIPPPTYEAYDEINKKYGNGRINAIISEYFLFAIMVVFIFLSIAGYLLSSDILGSWLESAMGITINPVVGKEIFHLITEIDSPLIGIGFFILAPQLIMNPYLNYILMLISFNRHNIPPLHDKAKFNSLTNYLSFDMIGKNFFYGTPCTIIFYFSAKIIIVIFLGVTFVSNYNIYVMNACLAFSITFMLACRSIALSEMFSTP